MTGSTAKGKSRCVHLPEDAETWWKTQKMVETRKVDLSIESQQHVFKTSKVSCAVQTAWLQAKGLGWKGLAGRRWCPKIGAPGAAKDLQQHISQCRQGTRSSFGSSTSWSLSESWVAGKKMPRALRGMILKRIFYIKLTFMCRGLFLGRS